MKGFLYFLQYAFRNKKSYLFFSVLTTLVSALSPVLLIYIPKVILDTALGGDWHRALSAMFIYAAAYFILNTGIAWLQHKTFVSSGRLFAIFQMDMAQRLLDADLEQLESNRFQEQVRRAEKYIYADGYGFGYVFTSSMDLIKLCITAAGYVVILFRFSPLLVLINLIFTIISFLTENRIKKLEKMDQDARIRHERITSYYGNVASDHRYTKDIRMFSYKPTLLRKMAHHYEIDNRFYAKIGLRHVYSSALSNCFYAAQIGVGYVFLISMLVQQSISVGDFTMYVSALTAYAGIMGEILDKLVFVHSFDLYFSDFKAYSSIPRMVGRGDKAVDQSTPPVIEFRNVSFRYEGSENFALKNISVTFDSTERVAIVGENGSGKTTFVKLLMRLYDPTEGQILLNGVDIREYAYDEYIKLFSAVFQDYSLFAATIAENITMDDRAALDPAFAEELSRIGLLKKAEKHYPKGFDTAVYRIFDDSGIEPSGGEGQQIAIARSLYKKARINILDEPTAALDPKIEYDLYQKYDAITQNNLSFFVSHRLGSCRFAKRILVFANGEIIEDGSHQELMDRQGKYRELFQFQASLYEKSSQ